MNVFYEFYKMAQKLQAAKIQYALIGGVAMAFHTRPRFTKDIDILVKKADIEAIAEILNKEGYRQSAPPWTFKGTGLTLHRFLKVEDKDEMFIDVLVAGRAKHEAIIDNALVAESNSLGQVRVVSRSDLIWLKKARNSKLDQADIEDLEHESS